MAEFGNRNENLKLTLGKGEESEVVSMLQKVPLFSSLGKNQLRTMAEVFKEKSFDAGVVIETEGDMGLSFYLIVDGAVDVRKKNRTIAKLRKGQFFGEMSLLDKEPRSATIVASEPTRCLLMTAWNWNSYLETQPKLAIAVMRELARRLRETNRALSE